MTVSAKYPVVGMTCQHCVAAVTQEVSAIDGVRDVTVDLRSEGASVVQITSDEDIAFAAVDAAVQEAGYTLAP